MITAAFFETEPQLEALREHTARDRTTPILVALSPEADYAAEKRGLSYCTIEDLYAEEDLIRRGLENYASLERLCHIFDRHVDTIFRTDPNKVFMRSVYHSYNLKRMMDAPLHRVFILQQALTKLQPDRIICFETIPGTVTDSLDVDGGSLCSLALPLVADSLGIEGTELPDVSPSPEPEPDHSGAPNDSKSHASGYLGIVNILAALPGGRLMMGVLRHARSGDLVKAVSNHFVKDGRRPILVAGPLLAYHDMVPIIEEMGLRVTRLNEVIADCREMTLSGNGVPSAELNALWEALEHDEALRELFTCEGIDYFSLVRERLRHFVFQVLPRVARGGRHIEAKLRALDVALVMGACVVGNEDIACFIAAKQAGIPSIVFQHGACFHNPIVRYQDAILPDYVCTFGKGVSGFLAHEGTRHGPGQTLPLARTIDTGWMVLDDLVSEHRKTGRKGSASRSARAMYIMSLPRGDQRYFSADYAPIRYGRLQRKVIELCSRLSHVHFYVKLYNGPVDAYNQIEPWMESRRFPHVELIRNSKLTDCLEMADLFIVDFPSTTLLEVMATDKKIVEFIDLVSYPVPEHMLTLLRKRVILSTREQDFLSDIERVLKDDDPALPEPINDEFLCEYGVHKNDGKSSERILETLRAITRGLEIPGLGSRNAG